MREREYNVQWPFTYAPLAYKLEAYAHLNKNPYKYDSHNYTPISSNPDNINVKYYKTSLGYSPFSLRCSTLILNSHNLFV